MRAQLERTHPDWHVWVIFKAVGGQVWCGRRFDGTGPLLNTGSAEDLAKAIEQAEAEPPR
jgi:hypothetical protein